MARLDAPAEIRALADERAAARRARDWATADELKRRIEAAGWKVVDSGTMYDLVLAMPPDVVEGGVTWYGASRSVPSRLEEAAVGTVSVVLVVDGDASATGVGHLVGALADHAPDGTQVVLVANAIDDERAHELAALATADPGAPGVATEVVRLAHRLGMAAALNAGMRRTVAPVAVWMDAGNRIDGDPIGPLVAALEDPGVAVAGPAGMSAEDVGRMEPAPPGARDVAAIDGRLLAFRRDDYLERGPLDEGFGHPASLDAWWSLVLRDGWFAAEVEPPQMPGEEAADEPVDDAAPPSRRAVQVAGLPVTLGGRPWTEAGSGDERLVRRNRYRLLKRFASRRDLLA